MHTLLLIIAIMYGIAVLITFTYVMIGDIKNGGREWYAGIVFFLLSLFVPWMGPKAIIHDLYHKNHGTKTRSNH